MVNNLDWLGKLSLIEFLRDIGKHFTVPYMLAKDSVQQRLERGLSFTEFSYMTLQAARLRAPLPRARRRAADGRRRPVGQHHGRPRADPADVGRRRGARAPAHGIAYKLLLSPSGAKFGKSEARRRCGSIPARTSPYDFYQYWLNTDDRDVGTYLRWFTLFERDEVEALDAAVATRPEAREAQRRLAFDVTARVHGRGRRAGGRAPGSRRRSRRTRRCPVEDLVAMRRAGAARRGRAGAAGRRAGDGHRRRAPTRRRARRGGRCANGGFYVNNLRVTDPTAPLPEPLHGRFWVVRTGKRTSGWSSRGVAAALRPAPETALVLVVALPAALEALRRRSIADARRRRAAARRRSCTRSPRRAGRRARCSGHDRRRRRAHPAMRLTLGEGRRFPDTLYASVDPTPAAGAPARARGRVPDAAALRRRLRVVPQCRSSRGRRRRPGRVRRPGVDGAAGGRRGRGRPDHGSRRPLRRPPPVPARAARLASSGADGAPWRPRSVVDDVARLHAALREQHERVVHEVRGLAGEQRAGARSGRRPRPRPPRRSSRRAGPRSPPR